MSKTKTPVAAIILAAGKGTRMQSALPKVLHRVAGLPMLGHCLHTALAVGAAPIAVVVGPGMDDVAHAARTLAGDIDIAIQREQLGTAHAVLAAKPALGEVEGHLLILYGDTPLLTAATINRVLAALDDDPRCAVCVLGFTPDDPGSYGRLVVDDEGRLTRIVEAKDATDDELAIDFCNSGVMALRGDAAWALLAQVKNANAKGEYYLTDVVELALKAGHRAVAVEGDADEVLGVNSRTELAQAEAIFQFRARQHHMVQGATLIDPDSVYFAADTVLGRDVTIEPGVFFGANVRVDDNVHIKAYSHIEGATIAAGSVVGPFARLRPGTQLGEDVKIGNFVELKAAHVARGAKISHLSYVGDATVGEHANLGAGTITCNYDGYLKHTTIIGRDVFVGSNSALVAPVTIGDGAMIAAGSTITADVTANATAIARSKQVEKPGHAQQFRETQAAKKRAAKKSS